MELSALCRSRGWQCELLDRGWSEDKKYIITTTGGERLLLRRSPLSQTAQKREEYRALRQISGLDIRMSRPLELIEGQDAVYMLMTWQPGEDAEKVLPVLPEKEQYRLGMVAGEYLKKIHSIPAPPDQMPWDSYYLAKIDRKERSWDASSVKIPEGEVLIAYLEENRCLLKGRPQCFQHGDYHVGNMVIDEERNLSLIDFNRWSYGDPWEEFNRITWSAQCSPCFASGMLNGYFEGPPPEAFFRLLKLYIACNQVGSIPWAIPFGEEEVRVIIRQTREVMAWYDGFRELVPNWYREV